jgi:photosystem II stability/assembly factor-like uncharacterized protein
MKKIIFLLFLLRSLSGFGQTWNPIFSPTISNINSSSFVSQDTGWVITNDSIFKTINGGSSWTSQSYPPDPAYDIRFFNSVHFINSNVGIIGCGNYLYTGVDPTLVSCFLWTNDGGINWVYKNLGTATDYILDAKLSSTTTAYGIGQYGQVMGTFDGGVTWTDMSYTSPYSGMKIFPISQDTVYYAGVENLAIKAAFGKIIGSSWNAWTVIPSGTSYFLSIYFFNYLEGWLCGNYGILYKTLDGGVSWTSYTSGVTSSIIDIIFTDTLNGWFATNDGKIYHTNDAGISWGLEYNGTTLLTDISFANNTGYAVGHGGIILKYSLIATGIKNENKTSTVSISPNPADDKLHIYTDNSFSSNSTLSIYNTFGKIVLSTKLNGQTVDVDISSLDNGVYIISVDNKNGTNRQKIIKNTH